MAKHGKRYIEAAKLVDPEKQYEPTEAAALVKKTATAKFDQTIEVHIRLGVDPRQSDEMVRGTIGLPHGTGKRVRIAVFAQGDKGIGYYIRTRQQKASERPEMFAGTIMASMFGVLMFLIVGWVTTRAIRNWHESARKRT